MEKLAQNGGLLLYISKNQPKKENRPLCENSPNLVTLMNVCLSVQAVDLFTKKYNI
jgi:hypothetical protein